MSAQLHCHGHAWVAPGGARVVVSGSSVVYQTYAHVKAWGSLVGFFHLKPYDPIVLMSINPHMLFLPLFIFLIFALFSLPFVL